MLVAAQTLPAQDLAAREAQFAAKTAARLHELADALQAQKQHGRAYALRKELLLEYAEDDAKARDKCGFTRVGNVWRADASKLVLEKDLTGDKKVLAKLEPQLAALRKEQLAEHRALADGFLKAGDGARAARHWRRVLDFAPGDKQASEALATQKFFGFSGTAVELGMLRRAWAIRGAVDWLLRWDVPVTALAGEEPLLAKAGLAHRGVRSEHFAVWGTLPPEQLHAIAQYAERSYLLCATLVGTHAGAPFAPARKRDLLYVANEADYHKVLDQCADQFDAGRLAFLKNDVDMAFVNSGDQEVRFVKTNGGDAEALDQAVRGVAQDALGIHTDGLWDGAGHAVCGYFFGKTLTFLLEQLDQKTVASYTQKLLVPDMKVWQEIAEQSAWAKSDSRTSEIVLISAAKFSTEQRVKAWAVCDYLWLWRPELLGELDRSQTKDIRTPPEVEREFARRTGVELPTIDTDWREYWAKKAELRKAMAADPLGDEKAKDRARRVDAKTVVDAVNAARVAALRGPVGFYLAEDPATQGALGYGDRLAKVEAQRKKKPKETIPDPEPPVEIGTAVLWSRGEPGVAVAEWLARPAWRDALLHPGRSLLGAARDKTGLAVDLSEAAVATRVGLPWGWPRAGQTAVAGSAPLAALGPRLVAAVRAAKPDVGEVVGVPLTLHFSRRIEPMHLARIACRVFVGNLRVDGVLVVCQGEPGEADATDGCVAFVPWAPLPAGATVEVGWEVPPPLVGKQETYAPWKFAVAGQ